MVTTAMTRNNKPKRKKQPDMCPPYHEPEFEPPEFHEPELEPPQSQLPEFDPDEPELLPDGLGNSSPGLVTPPGIWKRNIPQQLSVKHTTDRMNQIFAR